MARDPRLTRGTTRTVKRNLLMIAEVTIEPTGANDPDLDRLAQARLDAFREAVLPSEQWGIALIRVHDGRRAGSILERATDECVIELANGSALRCPAYPAPCTYVRVTNSEGTETSYWDRAEWERAPDEVMGAILGAANSDEDPTTGAF